MQRIRGFSLIELIVAVAIAAMLMAMASAAYHRYLFRARRVDAQHLLLTVAHAQERWYATYNRYTDELAKLEGGAEAVSQHAYYTLSIAVDDAAGQSYRAMAVPINAQAPDACGTLSVDQSGHMLPTGDDAAANSNGRCW